jgi:hypothetical protein
MLLEDDAAAVAAARRRVRDTSAAIAGFLLGCTLDGSAEPLMGLRSLIFSCGLALIAFALGAAIVPHSAHSLTFSKKEASS